MNKQELMALGLSEEAADQVLKAHVPYDRFRQVNEDKKALEGQLKERDEAISGLNTKLKAGEDAAASITQLQAQLKEKDAAFLSQRKEAAIHLALVQAKAKNTRAALALLEPDKLDLQEDGSVKGLSEALEALKQSDNYLFEAEQPPAAPPAPPPSGFNPPPPTPQENPGDPNAFPALIAKHYGQS